MQQYGSPSVQAAYVIQLSKLIACDSCNAVCLISKGATCRENLQHLSEVSALYHRQRHTRTIVPFLRSHLQIRYRTTSVVRSGYSNLNDIRPDRSQSRRSCPQQAGHPTATRSSPYSKLLWWLRSQSAGVGGLLRHDDRLQQR